MIPEIFIEQWRSIVKWQGLEQIEQDLIISKGPIIPPMTAQKFPATSATLWQISPHSTRTADHIRSVLSGAISN